MSHVRATTVITRGPGGQAHTDLSDLCFSNRDSVGEIRASFKRAPGPCLNLPFFDVFYNFYNFRNLAINGSKTH